MKNKYEELFDSFLSITDFKLIKYEEELEGKDETEDFQDGLWGLMDLQGADLGNIESNRFKTAAQIFARMNIYITDYFLNDIDELLEEKDIEVTWGGTCEEYLKNAKQLLPDYQFDFDILDMICNHAEEINLENCNFQND